MIVMKSQWLRKRHRHYHHKPSRRLLKKLPSLIAMTTKTTSSLLPSQSQNHQFSQQQLKRNFSKIAMTTMICSSHLQKLSLNQPRLPRKSKRLTTVMKKISNHLQNLNQHQ